MYVYIVYIYFIILLFYAVAPFVPSDFVPETVLREQSEQEIALFCPFLDVGNPIPFCTWNRIDSNNITHQIQLESELILRGTNDCVITFVFREADNGLYQCAGYNEIGNSTYTFPERYIVES